MSTHARRRSNWPRLDILISLCRGAHSNPKNDTNICFVKESKCSEAQRRITQIPQQTYNHVIWKAPTTTSSTLMLISNCTSFPQPLSFASMCQQLTEAPQCPESIGRKTSRSRAPNRAVAVKQQHADSARVTLSPFISDSSCQTDTLIHFSRPQTSEPNRKWNGIRLSTGSLFLYNRYQSTYTDIVHINTFEVVRRVMCYSKKSMKSAQFRFALQAQIET